MATIPERIPTTAAPKKMTQKRKLHILMNDFFWDMWILYFVGCKLMIYLLWAKLVWAQTMDLQDELIRPKLWICEMKSFRLKLWICETNSFMLKLWICDMNHLCSNYAFGTWTIFYSEVLHSFFYSITNSMFFLILPNGRVH
jgi:hypothetical protein